MFSRADHLSSRTTTRPAREVCSGDHPPTRLDHNTFDTAPFSLKGRQCSEISTWLFAGSRPAPEARRPPELTPEILELTPERLGRTQESLQGSPRFQPTMSSDKEGDSPRPFPEPKGQLLVSPSWPEPFGCFSAFGHIRMKAVQLSASKTVPFSSRKHDIRNALCSEVVSGVCWQHPHDSKLSLHRSIAIQLLGGEPFSGTALLTISFGWE